MGQRLARTIIPVKHAPASVARTFDERNAAGPLTLDEITQKSTHAITHPDAQIVLHLSWEAFSGSKFNPNASERQGTHQHRFVVRVCLQEAER